MTVYIVILAVLVLGGAIATAGDRIGTKVGKARLSLFKMRPRQTATVVTILSGSLVAATTLGILLATDKQLRTGLFELQDIQRDLATSRKQLDRAKQQKQQIEQELTQAQTDQAKAKQRLAALNQSLTQVSEKLETSIAEQAETEDRLDATQLQLNSTQGSLGRVSQERSQVEAQLNQTQAQKQALESEITTLQSDRQQLIEQREAVTRQIDERDRAIRQNQEQLETQQQQIAIQQQQIGEKQQQLATQQQQLAQQQQKLAEQEELLRSQEETLAERGALLDELKEEQSSLEEQVARLEYNFSLLRERRVAIGRGQVLASGVVRIIQPSAAERVVGELLREADRVAVQLTRPGTERSEPVIKLEREEFEDLLAQIRDGNEHVVRILSASNYILGETLIRVEVDVERNRLIFDLGEIVSAAEIDPQAMNQDAIAERIALLLEAARIRALQQGMLGERIQIADGQRETVLEFIRQLQQQPQPVDVQAIVADITYTAGPLKLKLAALRNGEVVLETSDRAEENPQ